MTLNYDDRQARRYPGVQRAREQRQVEVIVGAINRLLNAYEVEDYDGSVADELMQVLGDAAERGD